MIFGILTFHNADNYGAVLQCYALQKALEKRYPGNKVDIVDYKCPEIERSYQPRFNILKPWRNLNYFKILKKRDIFRSFREKYLNIGSSDLADYDTIYYGSDQIWNPVLTKCDMVYFGKNFNGQKIAYAASDGGEMNYDAEVCDLLNKFSKISCREKTLTEKLQNLDIKTRFTTVCDPVFLLSKEEWLEIAELPKEKNYVLAYKIQENLNFDLEAERIGKIFNKKVLQIVYVKPLRKIFYKKQKLVECITPEQFIGYFAKADFVLTTSFHGTAFSIIFEKNFYVLEFNGRSGRVVDLLIAMGLKDRFVQTIPSDFESVQNYAAKLNDYRGTGLQAL